MSDSDDRSEPRGIGLGYIIYQQVAGVLGAFALIAFLGHFVHLDWRGALSDLVGAWSTYVRPVMSWCFQVSIVSFLKWAFGWNVAVPLIVRDYFAVGLVTLASMVRAYLWLRARYPHNRGFHFIESWGLVWSFLLWPYVIARQLLSSALGDRRVWGYLASPLNAWDLKAASDGDQTGLNRRGGVDRFAQALVVAPVIYLGILLAANYLLLKPGT